MKIKPPHIIVALTAVVLLAAAAAFFWLGQKAEPVLNEAEALARQAGAWSAQATADLKLGRAAEAAEGYRKALELKGRAGSPPLALSDDRLGLALSLFMAGRPAEAVPLAEEVWRLRRGELGPGAAESLFAATRLATLYVAVNEPIRAEALLREILPLARAGGAETAAALAETELLLAAIAPDAVESGESAEASAAEEPLPEAALLRQELADLVSQGREEEFPARLEPVLAAAAKRFGLASREYLRYYSLRLKWLEECGRVEELTAELRAQAANPPGGNELERALNQSGALMYAARVNGQSGRSEAAAALYQEALAALAGREGAAVLERRQQIEAALAVLSGAESGTDKE